MYQKKTTVLETKISTLPKRKTSVRKLEQQTALFMQTHKSLLSKTISLKAIQKLMDLENHRKHFMQEQVIKKLDFKIFSLGRSLVEEVLEKCFWFRKKILTKYSL